mgnify:CR=1 FL=1
MRIEITFRFSGTTVKHGFKELLNKEQPGNSEPFPVTNLPVNKLALVNNFTMTKKFLIAKFDCSKKCTLILQSTGFFVPVFVLISQFGYIDTCFSQTLLRISEV